MTFRKKLYLFLTFAGPAVFFFCCVVIIPLIYGVYLTFTDWNGLADVKNFVGLTNYADAFQDGVFWETLLLTTGFSLLSVIFINIIAFFLAYLLTSERPEFLPGRLFHAEPDRRPDPGLHLADHLQPCHPEPVQRHSDPPVPEILALQPGHGLCVPGHRADLAAVRLHAADLHLRLRGHL